MAYNDSIKLEAENLFHRGYNLNQITELLAKKYPKISYVTISKWATTKDKNGKIWEDYKKEIIVRAREISHKSLANKYAEMKQKAEIIKEGLEHTLLSGKLEVKSIEGAIYAWKGLSEFIILIEEKYESKRTPKEIVLEFLDILNTVPQIRDALKKNWNLVEDELKRRLENEWGKNV
jgi:hypothetical protein